MPKRYAVAFERAKVSDRFDRCVVHRIVLSFKLCSNLLLFITLPLRQMCLGFARAPIADSDIDLQ